MSLPATPDAIPQAFADAWNARDPDALAALFDEDATFVNVVGLWWHDRSSIREAHAYGLRELFSESTLRVGRRVVKDLAPGVALVQARMRLDGQTAVGGVRQPGVRKMESGKRKVESGKWKVTHFRAPDPGGRTWKAESGRGTTS